MCTAITYKTKAHYLLHNSDIFETVIKGNDFAR